MKLESAPEAPDVPEALRATCNLLLSRAIFNALVQASRGEARLRALLGAHT